VADSTSAIRANLFRRLTSLPSSAFAACLMAAALVLMAGCEKHVSTRLAAKEVHAITQELEAAAHAGAPSGSEIHAELQASDKDPEATDHLDITITSAGTPSAQRSAIADIQHALGSVAIRHALTEEPSESRDGVLFLYLRGGVPTHAIHIHIGAKNQKGARSAASPDGPRLAIILDDLGSDRAAADSIFALPYRLTISVLPNHEHSVDIAEEAHRRGYEVMLHLPMESVGKEQPEARELKPGMNYLEVSLLVNRFLAAVPHVVGVNNHQGSEATADLALMAKLMPVIGEHKLFYIDSRTTAATVAFDTAERDSVPSAFRNVPFLDDVAEVAAVRKQLELALKGARERREAVAIGHPHPATLEALREVLAHAQESGVQLVFASEVVH
jgi:polysaccharide deacetylase 2 family uncharacterized protein YibQ